LHRLTGAGKNFIWGCKDKGIHLSGKAFFGLNNEEFPILAV
jgi:hypothetical protein